jgi:hypothetical protein
MNKSIRSILQVVIAAAALGAGAQPLAAQGITGKLADKARQQSEEQRREEPRAGRAQPQPQSRPAPRQEQPARREQPARQAPARPAVEREATPRREPTPRAEQSRTPAQAAPRTEQSRTPAQAAPRTEQPVRVAPQPTPRVAAPAASTRQADATGNRGNRGNASGATPGAGSAPQADRGRSDTSRGATADRGLLGTLIEREYDGRDNRERDDRDGRDRDRDDRDRNDRNDRNDRDDRDRGDYRGGDRDRDWDRDRRRPGRVVQYLPSGYRDYAWNNTRYYYHSGAWYQPYGTTYISVGIPFGLFVGTLPGAYTSFWHGSTRYYYSDYHYYQYEPVRRGYVVVRSPYGDDDQEYVDSRLDQDLYIYPAEGQSEQQQADDRYDCHRWAVDETGYDPIDHEYDADLREDYLRAITACLTGRGYTVR